MDTATTVEKASPVVAVSFHWNYHGIPEMRSAFDWYSKAVVELAREVTVIGHGHPRRKDLPDWYRAHGIEYVRRLLRGLPAGRRVRLRQLEHAVRVRIDGPAGGRAQCSVVLEAWRRRTTDCASGMRLTLGVT